MEINKTTYPWLLIRDGKNWENQKLYSITEKQYYVQSIPELYDKYVAASCYQNKGWLVLADNNTHECILLNISTMEKVQLPSTDVVYYRRCILSSQNIDATCRVIFFNYGARKFRSCYIGDSEFVEHEILIDFFDGLLFKSAISFNGKLYITTMENHLMCADFTDPLLNFTIVIRCDDEIKRELPLYYEQRRHYLVESSGELFFVFKTGSDHQLSNLKVYRADLDGKNWVRLKSLDDRAIFLDAANSFIVSSASDYGLTGNSVYFVNKFGKHLFRYDMEDDYTTISKLRAPVSYDSALNWVSV